MAIEVLLIGMASLALESSMNLRVGVFLGCVALALGMQNGAFRRAGGTGVHTTYLTGMTTSLITNLLGRGDSDDASKIVRPNRPANRILGGIWIAFVVGAIAGAATSYRCGGFGIFGMAVVLLALIVQSTVAAHDSSSARTK